MGVRDWFNLLLRVLLVAVGLATTYLLLWPVPIEPYAWQPETNPGRTGPYVPNGDLASSRLIPARTAGVSGVGPETIAIGHDGWLYTGLCDAQKSKAPYGPGPAACDTQAPHEGWIVRINPQNGKVVPYVKTGGRPLGMMFNKNGVLYVADAFKGILRIDVQGEFRNAVHVADCVDAQHPGRFPNYTDSLHITRDGTLWYTCPSQRFGLEDIRLDGMETQPTGRLISFDPNAPSYAAKHIWLDHLMFANGVTLPPSERFVLVNEWDGYRITRLWLTGTKRGQSDTFFENVPGYPDNIIADGEDTFWVGLVIRRLSLIDALHPYPWLMKALPNIPSALQPHATRYGWLIALDGRGKLKHNFQDTTGTLDQITGAHRLGDSLYLTTNSDPFITRIRVPSEDSTRLALGGQP
jgi:hypothetical protein